MVGRDAGYPLMFLGSQPEYPPVRNGVLATVNRLVFSQPYLGLKPTNHFQHFLAKLFD